MAESSMRGDFVDNPLIGPNCALCPVHPKLIGLRSSFSGICHEIKPMGLVCIMPTYDQQFQIECSELDCLD